MTFVSLPLTRSCRTILASLIVLTVTGVFIARSIQNSSSTHNCATIFNLLNARRRCEKDEPPKKQEYDELLQTLTWRIEEWIQNDDISHVTVYFRDLENGPIFGIDEHEKFAPASLLKVPIMIAVLKYAELYPEILDEKIGFGATIPEGQNIFDPAQTIVANTTYTVDEVMRRMIVYSDNSSKELLRRHLEKISPGILDQTFIDLGISLQNPDGSQFLTIKSYASLFRSLYNASYLNREMSQKALRLLSQVEFSKGIMGGIPTGTTVSHKFGFLDVNANERQLHDCGIVYHPKTPYLLCIMTRGKEREKISSVIGKISKMVFEEVSLHANE